MTTRYTDYDVNVVNVDDVDEMSDTEVSDFTDTFAAGLFWAGVFCLVTPLAPISIVAIPIGAVIWLCRWPLRQAEQNMSETARDTGASVQSGCALLWLWLVGLAVFAVALFVAFGVLMIYVQAGGGW